MKVSPLETSNKYNVLVPEETQNNSFHPIDPLLVTCHVLRFIAKLRHHSNCTRKPLNSKNNIPGKIPKTLIRSANLEQEVTVKVALQTVDTHARMDVDALLDCGATGLFINRALVQENGIPTRKLENPVTVYNIDGTVNRGGKITEEITLIMSYQGHKERAVFEVCDLGKTNLIIGYTWLRKHNPEVNWQTGEMHMTRCPRECNVFARQLKKEKKVKREKKSSRKYSVSVEEVPDEDMPNGDSPITIEEDDRRDLFRFIRGGQSWDPNPPKLNRSVEELVPEKYHEYLSVFQKKESERMPLRKPWDHAIEMKEGFEPKKSKVYPLSPLEQTEVDDFINEQLRKGYIRPSKSPQTSPIFFVPKKDQKKRMCTDYRYLNEWTVKNSYPLPLISEIIDKVGKAKLFTKLDLRWGYNNVRIKEGDEWKAAFATRRGSFEPLVMFFGMTNSPPTFQNMMNDILKEEIDRGVVIVFIDDILIYTEDEEGHEEIVKEVLRKLKENDLFLKAEKCTFGAKEIEFLGLIIGPDRIKMDPIKVEAITSWPIPKRVKDVQAFLGLGNFYRRFIKNFSKIAFPLHNLTRKKVVWRWGELQQRTFEELKRKFVEAPVLVPVDFTRPLRVESDASDYATGAVLSMLCEDEKWHPCAFLSKGLNDVERNYDVHDKEMLGIIRALEAWRHYLEGATHELEIWTDHLNLQYFMSAKKLNRRQARWALFLSRFNFHLVHKPGSLMRKADVLSRRPDHKRGVEEDNKDITLLKPEYFRIRALRQGHLLIDSSEKETLSKIRNCTNMDEEVVKAIREKKGEKKKTIKGDEWAEEQGLILFRGKVYVPLDIELGKEIVRLHHNTPISGHLGKLLVARNF